MRFSMIVSVTSAPLTVDSLCAAHSPSLHTGLSSL
ncbi:hypothetical protein GBAR_LOCUS21181 [Geodia barretti]|uniref:Uncharacterized protein n=1 Tax=Geodia barretti TaxID=519541 RepID=A0AA35T069_GEOBA|nr:hypothetical protein GBAR_LOCUS21181 [Geodia barretti]